MRRGTVAMPALGWGRMPMDRKIFNGVQEQDVQYYCISFINFSRSKQVKLKKKKLLIFLISYKTVRIKL
jgi:hypothetical protein